MKKSRASVNMSCMFQISHIGGVTDESLKKCEIYNKKVNRSIKELQEIH